MTHATELPFDLPAVARKKLTVDFDGGNQSSDAGVLLLRPNMPDMKRFVLFMIGTALLITIVVEVVVVIKVFLVQYYYYYYYDYYINFLTHEF